MSNPIISDVVDLKAWPYVVPQSWIIETFKGPLALPRGFLSDGASGFGIRDLDPEAFIAHDRLYVSPWIGVKPITKLQADLIYSQLLFRRWQVFSGCVRPVALAALGWKAWNEYRLREKQDPNWWMQERFVPHALAWQFPNWQTKYAVYVGAPA